MKEYEPKVSVIVPIYNVERYLMRCLDSLLSQTMEEIEFILLDDGSTDSSAVLAEKFAKKHKEKFHFVSHSNMGLSKTRNRGIRLAKGKFIGFVDSDDYVEKDTFAKLYKKALRTNADIVYAPYYITQPTGKSTVVGVVDKKNLKFDILTRGVVSFCNKLFKREVLLEAGEIPDIWFEDFAYVMPILSKNEKFAYVSKPLYHYVKRDDSIMGQRLDRRSLEMIEAWNIALKKSPREVQDNIRINILNRFPNLIREYFMLQGAFLKVGWEYLEQLELSNRKYLNPGLTLWLDKEKRTELAGIGNRIYINGFYKDESQIKLIIERCSCAFSCETEVVVLRENNCPEIRDNVFLYRKYIEKDFASVAEYCALCRINETGGIYIGDSIREITCFDYLKKYSSVWAFILPNVISHDFFGSSKNNPVVEKLIKNYWKQDDAFDKIILDLSLSANQELYSGIYLGKDNSVFLSPEITVVNCGTIERLCSHYVENGLIKDGLLEYNIENIVSNLEINRLKQEYWNTNLSYKSILDSTSWKLMSPFRKVKDFLKRGRC